MCRNCGPRSFLMLVSVATSVSRSWPSLGPSFAFAWRGDRHAERRRDRSRRMRGAEGVVLRLAAPRKARDAVDHAQACHLLAPAGEDLVRVGLVANIPDDAVLGRLEHVV